MTDGWQENPEAILHGELRSHRGAQDDIEGSSWSEDNVDDNDSDSGSDSDIADNNESDKDEESEVTNAQDCST